MPAELSDEDLMRRVQADDTRAFEELYDRYSRQAFGLARVICGEGSQRAEEAIQDGFLAIWRSRASYDSARGSARSWLLMLIRHRSIDMMRRGRRDDGWRDLDGEVERLQAPGSVTQDAEKRDQAEQLRDALWQLPVHQREAIALAYFGGLTHSEIAAHLRVPPGTVKGRIRLGMGKVRAEINPRRPPQSSPG